MCLIKGLSPVIEGAQYVFFILHDGEEKENPKVVGCEFVVLWGFICP